MKKQLDIFDDIPEFVDLQNRIDMNFVHEIENNTESEAFLKENTIHFNRQCQLVYNYLMSGNSLTSLKAITDLKVMHLARRILDLKEKGVLISDNYSKKINGKEWFMDEVQIIKNKQNFSDEAVKALSIQAIENGTNFKNYVEAKLEELDKNKLPPRLEQLIDRLPKGIEKTRAANNYADTQIFKNGKERCVIAVHFLEGVKWYEQKIKNYDNQERTSENGTTKL